MEASVEGYVRLACLCVGGTCAHICKLIATPKLKEEARIIKCSVFSFSHSFRRNAITQNEYENETFVCRFRAEKFLLRVGRNVHSRTAKAQKNGKFW